MPQIGLFKPKLKIFGANVRRERNGKGMSQMKLAERSDLSIRNIQRIEAGELNILITTAARIKKALGCSWADLFPDNW